MKTTATPVEQVNRLETESYNMLVGCTPYVKETKAEPTVAQFEKIRTHYSIKNRERAIGSERSDLESEIAQKVNILFQNDVNPSVSFKNFWDKLNSFYRQSDLGTLHRLGKLEGHYADLMYEYLTRHTLYELRFAELAKQSDRPMRLTAPYMVKTCLEAIERDDLNFFKRVGDVLRNRQFSKDSYSRHTSPLQRFLLCHWIKEINGIPPLYNLSQNRLLEVCEKHVVEEDPENSIITWENVEKTRQRLGLLTIRATLSSSVKKGV